MRKSLEHLESFNRKEEHWVFDKTLGMQSPESAQNKSQGEKNKFKV